MRRFDFTISFLGWALIVATAIYFGGHILVYMSR